MGDIFPAFKGAGSTWLGIPEKMEVEKWEGGGRDGDEWEEVEEKGRLIFLYILLINLKSWITYNNPSSASQNLIPFHRNMPCMLPFRLACDASAGRRACWHTRTFKLRHVWHNWDVNSNVARSFCQHIRVYLLKLSKWLQVTHNCEYYLAQWLTKTPLKTPFCPLAVGLTYYWLHRSQVSKLRQVDQPIQLIQTNGVNQ